MCRCQVVSKNIFLEVIMTTLNERLKELRAKKGLSQKQISKELNISDRNYQRYEYGAVEPVASTLIALADYFDVSLDYLCGRSDNPKINK